MGKAQVIPFGPQHPVLPEPLHLDLVVQDETVVMFFLRSVLFIAGLKSLLKHGTFINTFMLLSEFAAFVLLVIAMDTRRPLKT